MNNIKSESCLDKAIWAIDDYFEYEDELREFLFKNNLIESYEYWEGFWDFVYQINPHEDLKSFLDDLNIDSSGNRRDLVNRIKEHKFYDNFNEFYFKLSKDGVKYLNSIYWMKYFMIYLDSFDFYEFEDYLNSQNGDFMNIYLVDRHYELAVKRHDFYSNRHKK